MTIATSLSSGHRLCATRLLHPTLPKQNSFTVGGTRHLTFPLASNFFPRLSSSSTTAKTRVAYHEEGIYSNGTHWGKRLSRNTDKTSFLADTFQCDELHFYTEEELRIATRNFSEFNKLGNGFFGDVYRGWMGSSPVAIKRCRPKNSSGFLKQFRLEIDVLTKMRHHPNVVQLYGVCYANYCLVFEFMSNGTLDDHLGKLPWVTQLQIAIDITNALIAVHGADFVHRDIKPANILLDEKFRAKLADFGLATQIQNGCVEYRGYCAGTIWYRDPVYENRGFFGQHVDVYSLGATLVQMFYEGRSQWQVETRERVFQLSLQCVQFDIDRRPHIETELLPELKRLLPSKKHDLKRKLLPHLKRLLPSKLVVLILSLFLLGVVLLA